MGDGFGFYGVDFSGVSLRILEDRFYIKKSARREGIFFWPTR
ncbi:MAG TPA: hypothetical protein VKB86_16145 [Pyrinomonadaceae bacterium]|nr:hypothetical protein [Pyrinomonadaceae bacterium]